MGIRKPSYYQFLYGCTLAILSLFLQVSVTVAQSQTRDSLMALIPGAAGTTKVDLLNGLGKYYWERKPDTAIQLAGEAISHPGKRNIQLARPKATG